METYEEAHAKIKTELLSADVEVRAEYMKYFSGEVDRFSSAMATAVMSWRTLDEMVGNDQRKAYVSAWVYTAIKLHILSLKLFLSGHLVAAGHLFRQVVETMALALVCSSRELNVLDRFMSDQYSTNDAVRDALRHAARLGVKKESVQILADTQAFYHKYSHPSVFTILDGMSFAEEGLYVGASFDEGKMDGYRKEVAGRASCAGIFPNFIQGVKTNVAQW